MLVPKKPLLVIAWIFMIAVAAAFLSPLRTSRPPDFMPFYFGGKLAASGRISQLYDRSAYQPLIAALRATGERMNPVGAHYFIRPAFQAFAYAPFSFLPYRTASLIAALANLLLLGILVWKLPVWFPVSASVRVWLAGFMPFLWSIGIGQDTLLLTLIVAYSLRLASKGREVWAGLLLGIGVYKPHLIWAIPLALLAARRWRMICSFLAMSLALGALSFAAVGTAGIRQWIELVQAPSSDYLPRFMGNIRSLGLHLGVVPAAVAVMITVVSFAVVVYKGSTNEKVAAAVFAALLLSPHTYWQDYSLAALAVLLLAHPLALYPMLLPWPYFYNRNDMLPLVFLSVAFLVGMALKVLARHPRAKTAPHDTEALPATR